MKKKKCKICRRLGVVMFEKCRKSMVKKPHAAGKRERGQTRNVSEYGKELREKQELKYWYNLNENQFRKYVKEVLKSRGKVENVSSLLVRKLESRLDNVIFRVGLASSRIQARQLVSHSHFLVNNKKVNIPSFKIKIGDKIELKEKSKNNSYFKQALLTIKKENIPKWLLFDKDIIKVEDLPKIEEAGIKVDIPLILSFYSR